MAKIDLRFPSPNDAGWMRFCKSLDIMKDDLMGLQGELTRGVFAPTAKNIDRLVETILLFVPTSGPDELAAAREKILDFSFPDLCENGN